MGLYGVWGRVGWVPGSTSKTAIRPGPVSPGNDKDGKP
jgi:hypothetical protein